MSRRLATASSVEHETRSRRRPRTKSPSTDEQRSRETVDALTVNLADLDAAVIGAFTLLILGGLLTRLLHFSKGALSISSGTILLMSAIGMVISRDAGAVH